jgi:phosphoglycerate-specific signal transduction histidine kinase
MIETVLMVGLPEVVPRGEIPTKKQILTHKEVKTMRDIFTKSRDLEYFSESELSMQMGAGIDKWPITLLKELIDNALDACESSGAVKLVIVVTNEEFSIHDDGPGLPMEVIKKSSDYSVRISSNDSFVGPSRGQLGNALKLLWAASFVANDEGLVEVLSDNHRHKITIHKDDLSGEPVINLTSIPEETKGTTIKVDWPGLHDDFYSEVEELCQSYCFMNPHLAINLFTEDSKQPYGGNDQWVKKWNVSKPSSIWWYGFSDFKDLIKAYLLKDRDNGTATTLRDFLNNFEGFTGSKAKKKVTDYFELKGQLLSDLTPSQISDLFRYLR